MILSLGIFDIISTGQSNIGTEFAFLTAILPHKLCFSPHFRRAFCVFHRTFWTFSPQLHRTIWFYCQVRCRTIRQKLSHLNLAPGPWVALLHSANVTRYSAAWEEGRRESFIHSLNQSRSVLSSCTLPCCNCLITVLFFKTVVTCVI